MNGFACLVRDWRVEVLVMVFKLDVFLGETLVMLVGVLERFLVEMSVSRG